MSSVDYLREFVNERLTAAAEEIFGAFKRTIVEYEEELSRQRRLLENAWKPETKLNNKELPQQLSVRKTGPKPHLNTERELPQQHEFQEKEVLPDQQELCAQERNSNLDQEDPEPPRIKEEQEDLCSSQEGEQLVLKEETDTFIFTPSFEESDHSEDQTLYLSRDTTLSVAEKESLVNIQVINSLVSEPKTEHQFLSHNSYSPESQNLTEGMYEDSGSTRDKEPEPQRRHYSSRSHTDDVNNPNLLEIQQNTHTGKRSYICDTCGKDFKFQSVLQRHVSVHTGEKPYACKMCWRSYRQSGELTVHMRTHTGERPYSCKICGKNFGRNSSLWAHMRRTHNGQKPYLCNTCGQRFFGVFELERHLRVHTDTWFSI